MERHGRGEIELVSGKWVPIHRVNPLSSGAKKYKEMLLAVEKTFSGEKLLRLQSRAMNRQRLLERADDRLSDLKLLLAEEDDKAEKAKIREKIDAAEALVSGLEAEYDKVQEDLAADVELVKKAQFELSVWALVDQHGMTEEAAVRELDAKAETQICACLLGVDPNEAYREPKSDNKDEGKEDEKDDRPLPSEKRK